MLEEFNEASTAYEKLVFEMIKSQLEMDKAKDAMEVASAQVELSVINDAGGNEKQVGSTEAARKRMYDIARSKSTYYIAACDQYFNARMDYKYHQLTVRRLDLRMQFLIATEKGKVNG